ncbi:MAG TPA: hypothetical protein VL053_04510, partial [Arachidicoccus sp.]|nr:hypothetical protein [Arachidicoccus sp.]
LYLHCSITGFIANRVVRVAIIANQFVRVIKTEMMKKKNGSTFSKYTLLWLVAAYLLLWIIALSWLAGII